jgi:hypothetical protein
VSIYVLHSCSHSLWGNLPSSLDTVPFLPPRGQRRAKSRSGMRGADPLLLPRCRPPPRMWGAGMFRNAGSRRCSGRSRACPWALRAQECGTSVLTRATRRNIPEDAILHSHRPENLKSYKAVGGCVVNSKMILEIVRDDIDRIDLALSWGLVGGFCEHGNSCVDLHMAASEERTQLHGVREYRNYFPSPIIYKNNNA